MLCGEPGAEALLTSIFCAQVLWASRAGLPRIGATALPALRPSDRSGVGRSWAPRGPTLVLGLPGSRICLPQVGAEAGRRGGGMGAQPRRRGRGPGRAWARAASRPPPGQQAQVAGDPVQERGVRKAWRTARKPRPQKNQRSACCFGEVLRRAAASKAPLVAHPPTR